MSTSIQRRPHASDEHDQKDTIGKWGYISGSHSSISGNRPIVSERVEDTCGTGGAQYPARVIPRAPRSHEESRDQLQGDCEQQGSTQADRGSKAVAVETDNQDRAAPLHGYCDDCSAEPKSPQVRPQRTEVSLPTGQRSKLRINGLGQQVVDCQNEKKHAIARAI